MNWSRTDVEVSTGVKSRQETSRLLLTGYVSIHLQSSTTTSPATTSRSIHTTYLLAYLLQRFVTATA